MIIVLFILEFGVFARKTIQKRTQFGPLDGVCIKNEECTEEPNNDEFKYLLEVDKQFRRIDVSSEGKEFWWIWFSTILKKGNYKG